MALSMDEQGVERHVLVNNDAPLFERDPAAWEEHLAEGNRKQPRKRVSADVLVRDQDGRLLLVDPSYKPDWDLPGGMVELNEPPHLAAHREVAEELGIDIRVGGLLCVDWVAPHGPWDDLLAFIFDGGQFDAEALSIQLLDGEIQATEFVTVTQAQQRLRPHVWNRVAAALKALETGQPAYLYD